MSLSAKLESEQLFSESETEWDWQPKRSNNKVPVVIGKGKVTLEKGKVTQEKEKVTKEQVNTEVIDLLSDTTNNEEEDNTKTTTDSPLNIVNTSIKNTTPSIATSLPTTISKKRNAQQTLASNATKRLNTKGREKNNNLVVVDKELNGVITNFHYRLYSNLTATIDHVKVMDRTFRDDKKIINDIHMKGMIKQLENLKLQSQKVVHIMKIKEVKEKKH